MKEAIPMANIKINELFNVTAGTTVPGVITGGNVVTYGTTSPVGITSEIGKRFKTTNVSSKMSLAAGFLSPYSIGEIRLGYQSDNPEIVVMEIDYRDHDDTGLVIMDLNTKKVSVMNTHGPLKKIYPFVLYALGQNQFDNEACSILKTLVSKVVTMIPSEIAYQFSDAIYYSCKEQCEQYTEKSSMTEAELRQLNHTSKFVSLTFLSQDIFEVNQIETDFKLLKSESDQDTTIVTEENSNFIDEVFNGDYILNYQFPENDPLAQYPPIDIWDTYVVPPEVKSIIKKAKRQLDKANENWLNDVHEPIGRNPLNFIFFGAAGGGKSKAAEAIASALGMPYYPIQCGPHTEEDLFRGMTIIKDGKPEFVETEFLHAFKTGGVIVLEECNLTHPAVLQGALSQALVSPYIISENSVTPVKRHPQTIIIAAMNCGYDGTRSLNMAFQSRFPVSYEFTEMSQAQFSKIFELEGYESSDIKAVWKCQAAIKKALKNSEDTIELIDCISFRHARACLEEMKDGKNIYDAAEVTFVSSIRMRNSEVANTIMKDVLPAVK